MHFSSNYFDTANDSKDNSSYNIAYIDLSEIFTPIFYSKWTIFYIFHELSEHCPFIARNTKIAIFMEINFKFPPDEETEHRKHRQ